MTTNTKANTTIVDASKVYCSPFIATHNPTWDGYIAIGYVRLAEYKGTGPTGTRTVTKARQPEFIGRQVTPELIGELQAICDRFPRLPYLSSKARPQFGESPHFALNESEAIELDAIQTMLGGKLQ